MGLFRKRRRVVAPSVDLPPWVSFARRYIGTTEVPGKKHNQVIINWWKKLGRPYRDDETPYCGGFIGFVMASHGFSVPDLPEGARRWLHWGVPLKRPVPGCVVVFWRGKRTGWAGHVAIVTGITHEGNLMCIGANQGDTVSEIPFSKLRVLGYRWPREVPVTSDALDVVRTDQKLSSNEE